MLKERFRGIGRWAVFALILAAITPLLPATGAPKGRPATPRMLAHLSQAPVFRYWLANPAAAPEDFRGRFRAAKTGRRLAPGTGAAVAVAQTDDRFNLDTVGFPQNEESVSACRSNTNHVISGTNDYRGLLDSEGNFTGWHFSTDNGDSVAKEGLLPPVSTGGTKPQPSGGDPVYSVSEVDCDMYAVDLNYNPADPFTDVNGIGVYKTDAATLLSPACNDGDASDESCWPTRRYAAFSSDPSHFFDKPWFDVGVSGRAGEVVWVAYSDFDMTPTPPTPAGFTAEIVAVRCNVNLTGCTRPIRISFDRDVQFGDVTIAPDGRVIITWSKIVGELEGTAQTFIHRMKVAPAGSTSFTPAKTIFRETVPIPFGGFLHANDFRVATYPKNEVMTVGGVNRTYVVWDACSFRPFDTVCEEPVIKFSYSDNLGQTWTTPTVLSVGGDNYFPAIGGDPTTGELAVAWFTNRQDPEFHNRQDVELVTLDPGGAVLNRRILTTTSNETEADPLLGGFFIGDYIEVFAHAGTAYVAYNANYQQLPLLGQGVPIPQQDNYLTKVPM